MISRRIFFRTFVALVCGLAALHAQAVDKCGGQTSKGNPLPCCEAGGNCTWWAWKIAQSLGWKVIPTGNANTWDDFARNNSKYLVISSTPTVNSIGVKESAPYRCGGTDVKPKMCDTGHVGVITGLVKNKKGVITDVNTSQMSCASYGATYPQRSIAYYNYYISKK